MIRAVAVVLVLALGACAAQRGAPLPDDQPFAPLALSVLAEVSFEPGSSALTDEARTTLDQVREGFLGRRDSTLVVTGYVDKQEWTTLRPARQTLARARSTAVRDYLIGSGADGKQSSADEDHRRLVDGLWTIWRV